MENRGSLYVHIRGLRLVLAPARPALPAGARARHGGRPSQVDSEPSCDGRGPLPLLSDAGEHCRIGSVLYALLCLVRLRVRCRTAHTNAARLSDKAAVAIAAVGVAGPLPLWAAALAVHRHRDGAFLRVRNGQAFGAVGGELVRGQQREEAGLKLELEASLVPQHYKEEEGSRHTVPTAHALRGVATGCVLVAGTLQLRKSLCDKRKSD